MIPEESQPDRTLLYPATPLQQGMLFHALRSPGDGTDVEQMVCVFREELDASSLRQAWGRVVERHEALRSAFAWTADGQCTQHIQPAVEVPWAELDWETVPEEDIPERTGRLLSEDRRRGFDMTHAPLIRLRLITMGKGRFQLVWTFHHAILDGRSFPIILKEVFYFYAEFREGRRYELPKPRPFHDFTEWLQRQDFKRAEAYWRNLLSGFSAPTPLTVDNIPGTERSNGERQGNANISVPSHVTSQLQRFAHDAGLTLGTLVQGAWAILLSRYSGERDVVFGAVRACRKSTIEGAEDMVGLFINTLPLRLRVDPDLCPGNG